MMDRDLELRAECDRLVGVLRTCPSLRALRARRDAAELEERLGALLSHVRRWSPLSGSRTDPPREASPPFAGLASPGADADAATRRGPESRATLRAVHWNIEHGNRYAQVEAALETHPSLRGADLLLLNEVDLGMARSGNRDVGFELAASLGLHAAWVPQFLELTPGRHDDPGLAGGRENEEALQGLAILSRWPLGRLRLVPLSEPGELQFGREHMYGRHAGLVAEVLRPGTTSFVAVSAHLEVHRTRRVRAAQVRTLVEALRDERRPVVLAGDLNAHTFDRGAWHRRWTGGASLLLSPKSRILARLLYPDRGPQRELLFDVLREAGFTWEEMADRRPSFRLRLERVEEARLGPVGVAGSRWLRPAVARLERRARLKLDWFAARGWSAASGCTVEGLDGPGRASDHAPLAAELRY